MAILTATRTLRDTPGGSSVGVDAPSGAKVKVIERRDPWIKVELLGIAGSPKGWVAMAAVDEGRDIQLPLDKITFASQCAWQALIYDVSAHYMIAVAELRTDITDGPHGDDGALGPFSLTPQIWAAYSHIPEISGQFRVEDFGNWLVQCAIFAIVTRITQKKLSTALSDQPTACELYLAQLIGVSAAAAAVSNPLIVISSHIDWVGDATLLAEGIEKTKIDPALTKLTGAAALEKIGAKLDAAINDTKQFMATVSAELLSSSETTLSPTVSPNVAINFDSSKIPPMRKEIAKLIVKRFQDAGYGSIQQVAALANAIGESGLDPNAKSPDPEKSFGLFQLNLKGVGRGHSIEELKNPDSNISIMLDYIAGEQRASDWNFRAATSLQDAISIFVRKFERPADSEGAISVRMKIATTLVH